MNLTALPQHYRIYTARTVTALPHLSPYRGGRVRCGAGKQPNQPHQLK